MMLAWKFLHLFSIFQFLNGQTLPEGTPEHSTVCQGDILRASCPSGSIIATKDLRYGTKLTTTCAASNTSAGCCDYDPDDCLTPYAETSQQAACSGKDLCIDLSVAQADTSSCGASYPSLNHYLTMEYYCISDTRVSTMCSSVKETSTGSPLYLYNTDYPSPIRPTEGCTCSIETESCTSKINVYLVHLELDDGGGTCTETQTFEINNDGVTQTLTCSDNTLYTITKKLTSASNYLTVTLNNTAGVHDGKIWIGFEGTEASAPIKVNCPAAVKSMCLDCPSLPDPNLGSVSLSDGLSYASVATYSCVTEHKVVGNATRTCQADSTWDGTEPTCELVEIGDTCSVIGDCGSLANVECRDDGGGLQCLCEVGYTEDTTTTCIIVDCGNPTVVGYSFAGTGTTFGETFGVSCATGYDGTATPGTVACLSTGLWEISTGCSIISCPAPATTTGYTNPSYTNLTYESTATMSCDTGYTGTASDIICQADKQWSTPVGCTIIDCGPLTQPADGSLSYSSGTTYQSVATFNCIPGYNLNGVVTRTCQSIGSWSETANPTCDIVDCGMPTIEHGTLAGETTYGGFGFVTCNAGYERAGPASPDCLATGNWDTLPTCDPKDCGQPTIANGALTAASTTFYTGTAVVECDGGYNGGGPATCLESGSWDTLPLCDPLDCGTPNVNNGGLAVGSTTFYTGSAIVTCDTGYNGGGTIDCLITGVWGTLPTCIAVDCGDQIIANGELNGDTFYNGIANVVCDPGYEGNATATCLENGNWDTLPQCTPVDCGPPPTISSGAFSGDTFYTGTASVSCNPGYDGSGPAVCGATGTWTTLPTCSAKNCGGLAAPPDGSVDTGAGTLYPAVATFSCNTGYTLMGNADSNCQTDGTWDNLDPLCTINDCGSVTPPSNGNVAFPTGTTYGETAEYNCDAGYDINGFATRTCQADGTWSNNEPTCIIKDCGLITAPTNCDVTYTNNGATTYQEVATFTCVTGYELAGSSTRTCEASGLWSGSNPVCNIKDCGTLTSPANGAVNTATGTIYGSQASYSCDVGYSLVGTSQRQCQADGNWNGIQPSCQILDCSTLPNPTHGSVSIGLTTYNAMANYSCNTGYEIIGVSSRVCQQDGSWSDSAPTCQLADCGTPPYLLNGAFTTPTGTKYGATAVYTCIQGFGVVGSQTVQCLETGDWDTLPVCSEDCGTPDDIENGMFEPPSSTLKNATVTFSCNAGYTLVGKATIWCQNTGTWTTAPGCQLVPIAFNKSCSVSAQCETEGATCRSDGLGDTKCLCALSGEMYDSSMDSCLADCGFLTNPTNGIVTLPEKTTEGQIAVYSCNVGFALSDVSLEIRTCLSTGAWSLSAPLCVIGCPDPVPPVHGYVNVSEGRAAGDTVTFSCETGYKLVGVRTRVCRDDTTWSSNDPECFIECPLLSEIEDGSVDLSGGYWEGSIATYVCDKDYALVGTSTRTCQPTGQWEGVEPSCIFAIFPDVLLVVGALLIFLVIIDILVVAFCLYLRYEKNKKDSQPPKPEFDDIGEAIDEEKYPATESEEKTLEKLENGFLPSNMMSNGHIRASLKKQRNSKVSPEDANKKTPQLPRKPPVPKLDKSALKGIPKPKPLPKGAYKNNKPFGSKVYGPEPIRFKNETIPFVPLETSDPPPSTLQQQATDELKGEEKIADVEKLLKDANVTSEGNDNKNNKKPDEDQISIDHLTNPVFETDDKLVIMDYDAHTRKPITKLEDTEEAFRGRILLPKGPEKSGLHESDGEQKTLSGEARKHMKTTMSAYSPMLGNANRVLKA